jgi:Tfp pilus assembly protein FimT
MPRFRRRRGFTVQELLVVIVVAGLMMKIGLPKLGTMKNKNNLRAAKQQVMAYIVDARAAAVRRSRTGHFIRTSNTIQAKVDSASTVVKVTSTVQLDKTKNITVAISGSAATTDSIHFDPRGFATNLTGSRTYVLTVTGTTTKDSVCVSRLGLIARFCGQ